MTTAEQILYRQISLTPPPLCTCGECESDSERVYTCETCHRSVPWCFGADDDMFECCDDCWSAAHRGEPPISNEIFERIKSLKQTH